MSPGSLDGAPACRLGPPRVLRDLTLLPVGEDLLLVVACDSVGGIGSKPEDSYAVAPADTAHFAVRVPLLELLAAGARPALVVDTLCVESEPTGTAMVAAVRALAVAVGLDDPAAVTGSTEDNVVTRATGVGITVIGSARPGDLRVGRSSAGDDVVCLGLPRSAPTHRLYPGHPDLLAVEELVTAVAVPGVGDALPVGSRGVAAETRDLAASAGLEAELADGGDVDLVQSGGPASCVLVSGPRGIAGALRAALRDDLPVTVVATLRRPDGAAP